MELEIENQYLINYLSLIIKNKDASDDFIEVTEWSNGEGIDISIESRPLISLSFGELSAINYLAKSLEYHDE